MASELRPELALIDIGLPLVDGYEVARYVRRHQLPVCLVALTGYGQPEDHQRCMDAGFDEHLVKPVDPERLTELLRKPASHSSGHVG
jgi:two-component system, sensor histidine kinase